MCSEPGVSRSTNNSMMNNTDPNLALPFSVNEKRFLDSAETANGLYLNNILIPEEIVLHILGYVNPKELLKCSLVCHKWNSLIKSYTLWARMYERLYQRKPKALPWFIYHCFLSTSYFDTSILANEEGQAKLQQLPRDNQGAFKTLRNSLKKSDGEGLLESPSRVDIPLTQDALVLKFDSRNITLSSCRHPMHVRGYTNRKFLLKMPKNKLFQYIVDNYRPHIYVNNCGYLADMCCGSLVPKLHTVNWYTNFLEHTISGQICQQVKQAIVITDYPKGVRAVLFELSEVACEPTIHLKEGIVKFKFESIEPLSSVEKKTPCRILYKNVPDEEVPY